MLVDALEDSGEAPESWNVEMGAEETEADGEFSVMKMEEEPVQAQTMELQGSIHGVPIMILIDSGATHNFISKRVVEVMGWIVQSTPALRIRLGDGHKAIARGKCKQVEVGINGYKTTVDVLPFDLEGIDLVLRVAWLVTLGEMIVHWGKQTMKFQQEGKWVCLQAQDFSQKGELALESFFGQVHREAGEYYQATTLRTAITAVIPRTENHLTEAQEQHVSIRMFL